MLTQKYGNNVPTKTLLFFYDDASTVHHSCEAVKAIYPLIKKKKKKKKNRISVFSLNFFIYVFEEVSRMTYFNGIHRVDDT